MQADQFYQTQIKQSTRLVFLSSIDFQSGKFSLSKYEHQSLISQDFKGEYGEFSLIHNSEGFIEKIFIGHGVGQDVLALASVVNRLPKGHYHCDEKLTFRAILVWSLAQYRFLIYKSKSSMEVRVLRVREDLMPGLIQEARAVFRVRDLINQPANMLNPQSMAEVVKNLALEYGAQFEQWVGEELETANYPATYMVGKASAYAPRFCALRWGSESNPRVTLIGKAVCFDSGGLDLKASSMMRLMKKDMGGAAQVIALAEWLMACDLPIRLEVLLPIVENAVGSAAFRPGDVLRMRSGLTVEIDNTDAEGRLILADALTKATESNPELMVDFATLTGAARIAVGTEISAMFANDDAVAQELLAIGQEISDPIWRLPLFAPYASLLDSSVADLLNSSSSSYAGAITAALFLQRFVPDTLTWVHFDVMAWNIASKPGKPEGGEAMAMQAMAYYLIKRYG